MIKYRAFRAAILWSMFCFYTSNNLESRLCENMYEYASLNKMPLHFFLSQLLITFYSLRHFFSASLKVSALLLAIWSIKRQLDCGTLSKPPSDISIGVTQPFHPLKARGLWCREAAWRVTVSPWLRLNENMPLLLEALSSGWHGLTRCVFSLLEEVRSRGAQDVNPPSPNNFLIENQKLSH